MSHYPYYRHQSLRSGIRVVNGTFHYITTSKVALTATWPLVVPGVESVKIGVVNGDPADLDARRQTISTTRGLVCDLSVSGPDGLHPDHLEQNSTVYAIYAAWRSSTAEHDGDVCLFAVPSGTTVNAAKVADLYPANPFDYWSECLGFVVNSGAGNIHPFYNLGSMFWFHASHYGIPILVNGTAIFSSSVPIHAVVPKESAGLVLSLIAENTGASERSVSVNCNRPSATYLIYRNYLSSVVLGNAVKVCCTITVPVPAGHSLVDLLKYSWSGAPVGGLNLSILGVMLY
jgi:hypothetical protein